MNKIYKAYLQEWKMILILNKMTKMKMLILERDLIQTETLFNLMIDAIPINFINITYYKSIH